MTRRKCATPTGVPAFIALLLGATIGLTPAAARAADTSGPQVIERGSGDSALLSVDGESGFLQVRDNGQLWYWEWTGTRFIGHIADRGGWGQTKLVALLEPGKFVEVKGDALRAWRLHRGISGYYVVFLETVDTGWANTRLLTGVGDIVGDGGAEFVQVRNNGDLMLYRSQGNGYVLERRLDNGYEHARLIAGHDDAGVFVEVNDRGDLWEVFLRPLDTKPFRIRRMSGWENVRLLGPGGTTPVPTNPDSFVSVRYDGQLVQWYREFTHFNFVSGYTDTNWFNARLIG